MIYLLCQIAKVNKYHDDNPYTNNLVYHYSMKCNVQYIDIYYNNFVYIHNKYLSDTMDNKFDLYKHHKIQFSLLCIHVNLLNVINTKKIYVHR